MNFFYGFALPPYRESKSGRNQK